MGLFSSIGKVLGTAGKIYGAVTGNPLVSAASDLIGGLYANRQAANAATTAWGRTMDASNTSYQRAVADMRAAGLNPILAYSQGGASTPTAQVSSTAGTDVQGTAGTRAIGNIATASQIQNVQQATRTSAASERLTYEQAERERLNNQGLKVLPPEVRAIGQMANNTGSAVVGGSHFLKRMYDSYKPTPRLVNFLLKRLSVNGPN